MFALVVRFDLRPGCEAAFDELVAETLAGIVEREPGTILYITHQVETEPGARVFYEAYRDRAAFDAHEQTAHTLAFLSRRERYLTGPPRVEFLQDARGKVRATGLE